MTGKLVHTLHPGFSAIVLLHLLTLRYMYSMENEQPFDMFDNPHKINSELAKDLFCMLERFRNHVAQNVEGYAPMINEYPQIKPALYHTTAFMIALEILASTVGLALNHGKHKRVALMYSDLQKGYPHISGAYTAFREIVAERKVDSKVLDINLCISEFSFDEAMKLSQWKPDVFHELKI